MTLPVHSPKGASSSERWINCPGSATLIKLLGGGTETEEPEWRDEGTAAHTALNHLLKRPEKDAWELAGIKIAIGKKPADGPDLRKRIDLDQDSLNAVQVGVDTCRKHMTPGLKILLEQRISSDKHPDFYGTVDFAAVSESLLVVIDYKHGAGIPVDVEENSQLMYYAYGILLQHPGVRRVVLKIVQPRIARAGGPVQRWELTAEALCEWAEKTLIPAMHRADKDKSLQVGEHCRFCPAKLVCPLQRSIFEAASTHDVGDIRTMDDRTLAQCVKLAEPAFMYLRALKDETYRRLMAGKKIEGQYLVQSDKHRVWKPEAEAKLWKFFGEDVYDRKLKSPSQIEEMPGGGYYAAKYAFKPQGSLTLATPKNKKSPVVRKSMAERFAGQIKQASQNGDAP